MKKRMLRIISAFVSGALIISSFATASFAAGDEAMLMEVPENAEIEFEGGTEEPGGSSPVFSDDGVLNSVTGDEIPAQDDIDLPPLGEFAEEGVEVEGEGTPGTPESGGISLEEPPADEEIDNFEEAEEGTGPELNAELAEGEAALAANPSVIASKSSVTLSKGSSENVTITCKNISGRITVSYGRTNTSSYSCRWNSWSGYSIPLTIMGNNAGSGYVYVYLKNSSGSTVAYTRISVIVNSPSLIASASSVPVKPGTPTYVYFSCSGYSGSVALRYSNTNSSAYSCAWQSWSGSTIPLKITGKKAGSGTIAVSMYVNGQPKTSVKVSVTVTAPQNPKITVSPASATMAVGESKNITVKCSGYSGSAYVSYSTTNSSSYSCAWQSSSGSSIPLKITGRNAGSGIVRVYLKNSSGSILASTSISVTVYMKDNPKVTLSASSVSVKAGSSQTVNCTVSGVTGTYYLQYSTTNSSAYSCTWGKWSGKTIPLVISGKNAGSGSVTVRLKSNSGSTLASATIYPVKVTAPDTKVELKASKSSVTVNVGSKDTVIITCSNCDVTSIFNCTYTGGSYYECSWGSVSGNSVPLYITGKSKGSGTVTIKLKRKSDNAVLAQVSFPVTVTGGGEDNNPSSPGLGYSFSNYSKNPISLDLCKYMFGDNQTARTIYSSNVGNGGVCFGMSTTASMLSVSKDKPLITDFKSSAKKTTELSKTSRGSLGLSVSDFVEAMHITQKARLMYSKYNYNLDSFVSTVKSQSAQNLPVLVCIWGYNGGHAVVAYGCKESGNTATINIYDCNYPNRRTTLTLTKSGSSYSKWSYTPLYWSGSANSRSLAFVTYSDFLNVWNQRGKLGNLNGMSLMEDGDIPTVNFLSTTEKNFSIFDGLDDPNVDKPKVQCVNGEFTILADGFIAVPSIGILPGHESDEQKPAEQVIMLYLPVDYYTVTDDSPKDGIKMTIVGDKLSSEIDTDADKFDIYAEDATNNANVVLTPKKGEDYSISIGSLAENAPESVIDITGIGLGEKVEAGLKNGELNLCGMGMTISMTDKADEHTISVIESQGGSISAANENETVEDGGSYLYLIKPDEGYRIANVYVDDESVGAVSEYYFESVTDSHTISAEFAKDLSKCEVKFTSGDDPKRPVPVVKDGDTVLQEGVDYYASYNIDSEIPVCTIAATENGTYGGILVKELAKPDISLNVENNVISATVSNNQPGSLICAIYDKDSKMLESRQVELTEAETIKEYRFDGLKLPEGGYVKAFLLDKDSSPYISSEEYR